MTGPKTKSTDVLSSSTALKDGPVEIAAVEGPSRGCSAVLDSGSLYVGTDPACGLVLTDSAVSRRHLVIEVVSGAVRVRDLGSRNGTFFMGARIEQAKVPFGGSLKLGRTRLEIRSPAAREALSERNELAGLVGSSVPMRRLYSQLERIGPTDSTVLITGETGVGKELVARALHSLSPRAKKPFVVFDCAAVSGELLESDLFGAVKGAYSGADSTRSGVLEAASEGTLFLDEVCELPLELQPKFLRFVEAREFRRVGDSVVRKVSVRVIASTRRSLAQEVKEGRFREDLYYRLAVQPLEVPTLRSRPDDVPLLAAHFARGLTSVEVKLDPATLMALQCDPWPGNVRELRNTIERVLSLGEVPRAETFDLSLSFRRARALMLDRFERDFLVSLLERSEGNIAAAARAAKFSRTQLYRLLKKHRLGGAAE